MLSGVALSGAILYDTLSAAAAGSVVGAAAAGLYLSDKPKAIRNQLTKLYGTSALIATLATGVGYSIGANKNSIRSVKPFNVGEERGIVIEQGRKDKSIYIESGQTNYVSLPEAMQQEFKAITSSYTTTKEKEIQTRYDEILRAASPTNKMETGKR